MCKRSFRGCFAAPSHRPWLQYTRDFHVATFGDTTLSNLEIHNIAAAKVKSFDAGRLSINAYRMLNKESYSKIAAKLFIAENTISYRIKKILELAPDKTKEEVFTLLSQFLF